MSQIVPLTDKLREIGARYGKTPAQVALSWLAGRPKVLPIPGAKNTRHIETSVEAVKWKMSEEDFRAVDEASQAFKAAR